MATDVSDLFATEIIDAALEGVHVPRSWLLDRTFNTLSDEGCRGVLLSAAPGWGKTSFIAWLLRQRPDAMRYFVRRDSRRAVASGGARAFLTSIGHQLATLRPELFQADDLDVDVRQQVGRIDQSGEVIGARISELVVSPFARQAIRVQQTADTVSGRLIGVDIDRVVSELSLVALTDLYEMALLAPARALARLDPDSALLVVVDGLDELRYQPGADTILDWLTAVPGLPANVRLLVTSRPDDELLDGMRQRHADWLRELRLDEVVEEVTTDLTRYARQVIAEPNVRAAIAAHHEPDHLVRQAVAAAHSNFLYLRTLLSAVRAAALDTPADASDRLRRLLSLDELPGELDALYAMLLTLLRRSVGAERVTVLGDELGEQFLVAAWDEVYRPLLGTLAVARAPISPDQATYLGGIRAEPDTVRSALARMRPFLSVADDRFTLFHDTMKVFLTGTRDIPELTVSGPRWHRRVAGNALRRHHTRWTAQADSYALAHTPAHLLAAMVGQPADQHASLCAALADLVTSLDFATEKISRLGIDDLVADLRETVTHQPTAARPSDLLRVCEADAHHLRLAGQPESGISAAQQLLLRSAQLDMGWLTDAAEEILRRSTTPYARRLWSRRRESSSARSTLIGHHEEISCATINDEGTRVLTTSQDGTARLWETGAGALLASARHPSADGEFTSVIFGPGHGDALLGDATGAVLRWDLETRELRRLPVSHPHAVVGLAVVLDGAHVVSGCRGGTLRLWRADSGVVRDTVTNLGDIRALATAPTSTRVAFVTDAEFAVWDLEGRQIDRYSESVRGITTLAASADGRRIVSGGYGGLGEVWCLDPPEPMASFRAVNNTESVAVTVDGRLAVFATFDGAYVFDVEEDRLVQVFYGHAAGVRTVAVASDGRTVVTGSQDRTAQIWSLRADPVPPETPDVHSRQINAVARTPDGGQVVSVSQDWTMRIWGGEHGELRHTGKHLGWAQSLVLSDDGRFALTGSLYWLHIWDVTTGEQVGEIRLHDVDGVRSLVRTPDDRLFLLGSAQGDIYYFFDGEWQQLGPLASGHTGAVNMLAVSPDSTLLASASQDRTVKLWDLTGSGHRVLDHGVQVFAVCFSTDGRTVISGADDGVIRIWDTSTGDQTGALAAHEGWVLGLTPSTDNHTLVSVSEDMTLAIWDLRDHSLRVRIGLDTVLWSISGLGTDDAVAVGDLGGGVQLLQLHGLHATAVDSTMDR